MVEVPVVMEQGEPVPQRANPDQAVDPGADGEARSSRRSVELRRLLENVEPERGLDDRKSKHGLPRNLEGVFLAESLKHFLQDRKASHDFLDRRVVLQAERPPFAEDLDPDRRINEKHGVLDGGGKANGPP